MPASKVIAMGYLGSLSVLALFGGFVAWAQAQGEALPAGLTTALAVPASEVAVATPLGPVMLDLGNLTMPGALVVCTWLVLKAGGIPIRLQVDDKRHREENSGIFRLVREEPTGGVS